VAGMDGFTSCMLKKASVGDKTSLESKLNLFWRL